jgi:hypothetical protein
MNPTIAIYHTGQEWRAECQLVPELDCTASTLTNLLHDILHQIDHVVDSAVATAAIMRREVRR